MLEGLIVGSVELFLQDGSVVAAEDHGIQIVTLIERLVADGSGGIGQGHHLGVGTGKGVGADTDGVVSHMDIHGIGAGVGDQFQAGIDLAVQGAVDDLDGVAQVIGVGVFGTLGAIEGLGLGNGEGLQDTHSEGVVAQGGQVLTQGHLEGGQFLLQEGEVVDDHCAGQVGFCNGGMGEGVCADVFGAVQVLGAGEGITVGEGTLADVGAVFAEGHIIQGRTVDESVLADGLGSGQIHGLQSAALNERIVAHGDDPAQIDVLQGHAACESVLGDLGDVLVQLDVGHLTAVSKGIFTDALCGSQIHSGDLRCVVGIDVLALGADSGIGHGVVHTDVVNVAGEGIVADGLDLRQADVGQAGVIVEGHLADLGIGAQGDSHQVGVAGKGILAQDCVVADDQGICAAGKLIVEVLFAIFVVVLDTEDVVGAHIEGIVAQGDIIADGHGLQSQTLTEHTLGNGHAVGDGHLGQVGEGEGVFADLGVGGELGQFGDGGLEESVLTDLGQLAQGHGGDGIGRTEGVVAQRGDLRQVHSGDLPVVGESAVADGGNAGGGILALQVGRHGDQGLAVGREDLVGGLNLVSLAALGDLEGADLGVTERELADVIDVGANGDLFQVLAFVEHTLRQDGCVDVELFQSLTAGEGVGAVLDLGGLDGHILQILTAGKGILADGQDGVGQLDALQIHVARKGVVGNNADGIQFQNALQTAVFESVLADDLQVVLTAEGDLFQSGTAVEGAVLNGLQGGGQNHLFQAGQVCESVGVDLFHALGDDDLGNGGFTDVPLLAGFCIVEGQFFLGLGHVLEVGESEGADLLQLQPVGDHHQAAVAVVVGQAGAGGDVGILDLHGDGLGIVSAAAIHHDLDGDGGEALLHGGDDAVFIDGHDALVAGSELHRGVVGEVGVQVVVQTDGFGRIHGQVIITLEEAGIASVAQFLFVTADHEVSLQGFVAGEGEDVGHRLVVAAVALIVLAEDSHGEGNALVGGRIAHLHNSLAGGRGHQLIVDHPDNTGPAGSELQQFAPLAVGVDQRIQGIDLVGAQGNAHLSHSLQSDGLLRLGLGGNGLLGHGLGQGLLGFGSGLGQGSFRLNGLSLDNLSLNDFRFDSLSLLDQFFQIEVGEVIGQADLVGGVVQCVVIAGQTEAVAVHGVLLDLVDVVGQFEGDIGHAVPLGVDGRHVLLEGQHLGRLVAVAVGGGGNIAQLSGHGVMVVIDSSLGVQAVLLGSLVVLIVELHIRQGGSLEVHSQGELEGAVLIGLQTAVAVVQIAHQLDGVLGVVGQVVVLGIEFDLHVGGIDGAAVAIGLADVGVHSLEDHLAGGVIGNGDLDALGISQQAGPDEPQGVYGALLVGQGDVIPVCGDDHVIGILQEVVGTQIADVILGHAADGAGGVGVGHGLVFHGDGVVQLIGVGGVVVQVEQRGLDPVAVKGQVGNAQIDVGALGGGQGDKALHVHTVGERIVQISLVLVGEGDGHGHVSLLALVDGQLGAADLAALHGGDLHGSALQDVGLLGDGGLTSAGLGIADALGEDVSAHVIGQVLVADVLHGEGHGVHAGLVGVVAQFQLGLVHLLAVFILGDDVGGGIDGVQQICQAGALLTDGVGLAVGVDDDIGGGHQQPVDHGVDGHVIVGDVGEVLHDVLPHQQGHACQVGAGHGGAGHTVITAAGDGGQDVAAVGGDLRLDLQAGSGAPGGEVRNEGAGGLLLADGQLAAAIGSQQFAVVLGDGTGGQLGIAHVHLDLTGHIVIDDDAGCTLGFGDQSLLFEGVVTAAHQRDFAGDVQAGVVSASADTGNQHIFKFLGLLFAQQGLHEVVLFRGAGVGLVEVDDGLIVQQVGSLHTVDGGDGHGALIGAGRTDGTGVGVGGQAQVTVLLGTVGGGVAVGGSYHHADAGVADLLVNAVLQFFLTLPAEAAGSTQRHIDDVHTQDDTVFQSVQDPGSPGGVHDVGEDLHAHQLGVGGNAGDGVVVAGDDAGDVGAVVVVGGVSVGIVVGVVISEGNLLIDINVVCAEAAVEFVSLGLADDRSHIVIGHGQLLRGEVVHGEGGVVGIQTGVQDSHHSAGTVIAGISALEDTGLIDVDGVLHQLGLGSLVDLADGGGLALAQGHTGHSVIAGLDHQFEAGQQRGVIRTGGIGDALLIQGLQDPRLLCRDLGLNGRSLFAFQRIFREGHGLIGALVGIHQVHHIHGDDHRDLLILPDVVRKREHHGIIQIFLIVGSRGILHLLDVGRLGGRGLRSRLYALHRHNADQHRSQQEQRQESAQRIGVDNLLHVYSRLSFV